MSTYVIGDIQGCYKPLRALLKFVRFSPASDTLWCVGDLINRGPQSLDTLRYLQDLGGSVKIVLGNHDLHFIAINEGCAPARSKDTLDPLLRAPDCQQLSDWLRHQSLAHYDSVDTVHGLRNFLMIHAGVAPMWTLQDTLNFAAEVEYALQGPKYRKFLRNMYGDEPARWHNGLQGMERLRVITNYLTRARFCNDIGTLRLNVKEGLWAAPRGFKPWFEYERITPRSSILFGHWAALEGRTGRPHVYALDTGYVWGKELTLKCLEDDELYCIEN